MLQVKEVLQSPMFQNFQLLAGEQGLEREVRSVSILEYEAVIDNFADFSADTLILTSLFYARENPGLLLEALKALTARGIAGFAVKAVFFQELPAEAVAFARQQGLPLFLFHDTYMEDIVVAVNDLLKIKQNYLLLEEKVAFLLQVDKPSSVIGDTAHEINPFFAPFLLSAYILPKDMKVSLREVQAFFERLFYKKYRQLQNETYSYIKYGSGILLLASFRKEEVPGDVVLFFRQLMRRLDIIPEDFFLGISTLHRTFHRLDTAVRESLHANTCARFSGQESLVYDALGMDSFLLLLADNKDMALPWREAVRVLREYDEKYTSSLLDTMQLYVEEHGEIAAVAGRLFQHPNTIRYRIKKARELLEPVFGETDFYEQLFLSLRLYLYDRFEDKRRQHGMAGKK